MSQLQLTFEEQKSVRRFFEQMSPERRVKMRAHYELLLSIENGTYVPGKYPLHHKLAGKQKPYPDKMYWMKEAWEAGLSILNDVIKDNP